MRKKTIKTATITATPRSFYLVLWTLPLLLLLAFEFGLRWGGFGTSYPLFITAPEAGYLQPNPLLVRRYVDDPRQAPPVAPDSQYFLAEKPKTALRLVVAGESTAAGFPYGRFGSPAALLHQQLKRQYPDQQIEVISVAMAAINSYTVLDIMPEVLAIKPDAILVYLGHNEYVGLLGAGSQFQASPHRQLTLWWLQLKQLKLYQLVQQLLQGVMPTPKQSAGQTTMAQMASQSGIAIDSPAFVAGIEQFQDNMAAISDLAKDAAVPLVLTTLVSNEQDLPPFLSVQQASTAAALAQLNESSALEQLTTLLKSAPDDASLQYRYGQALLANRQPEAALQALQHAKELDLLRFRAPAAFNQWLREHAKGEGIWLADAEQLFRQQSTDGILGADLLLEHVHPNQRGYQLLAQSWLRSLHQAEVLPAVVGNVRIEEVRVEDSSLLSLLDQINAQYKIALLLADYPFDQQQQLATPQIATFTKALAHPTLQQLATQLIQGGDWLGLHQQLFEFYQQQRDAPQAAKVAALLADALPFQTDIAFAAGQLYFMAEDLTMARYYQQRAVRQQPQTVQFRLMLARTLATAGDLNAALSQLATVLQQQPDHPIAIQQQARLREALAAGSSGHSSELRTPQ
jgi:lysophospholipase L1-like esterase